MTAACRLPEGVSMGRERHLKEGERQTVRAERLVSSRNSPRREAKDGRGK